MVVHIVYISNITTIESKDNPPVSTYHHGPEAGQAPTERMKPVAGLVHLCNCLCRIEERQYFFNPANVIGWQPGTVSSLKQMLKSAASEPNNHAFRELYSPAKGVGLTLEGHKP